MDKLVKRLRSWSYELKCGDDTGRKAADIIEAQAAEIAALRAQPERDWIGERLRWEGQHAYLKNLQLPWEVRPSFEREGHYFIYYAQGFNLRYFPTEAEARAAVEKAVREALGE